MGQASILNFLEKYKKSEIYKKRKWLSTREIFNKMENLKDSSGIGSVTVSIKKLRDSNMIFCKTFPIDKTSRMIMHYQAI